MKTRQIHSALAQILRQKTLFLLVVFLFVQAAQANGQLQVKIEEAIIASQLGNATVAVSVRNAKRGDVVVNVLDDAPMMVASNMKLLTSGAALHVLGANFEFRTAMRWDGRRLVITGDGDPAFGDPELLALMGSADKPGMDIEQFINLWVNAIAEAKISTIDELIVDDRIFDRQFVHPRWPADQLNARYCAQAAGFNFHLNILHVYPSPRAANRPLIRFTRPDAPWLAIQNRATSETGPNDSNTAWISRPNNTNDLTLFGNVKFAYQIPVPVTFHNPPQFFADLMADRLKKAGVKVTTARVAAIDDPPASGDIIGPVVATPISTVLTRCNRDSVNLYAESLIKRLGHELTKQPGSWENGPTVLRHIVLDRLRDPSVVIGLSVSDGSGLSRDNRVPAGLFTAWLCSFSEDSKLRDIYVDSLAVGGETGTLGKRFNGTNLHGAIINAKSGYIDGVSTLSGYVTMPDGSRRAFSVLVNGFQKGQLWRAKDLQERVVALITADMESNVSMTLGSD